MPVFCALIKTKSAHDKLQSIKNAWSKDEIWCLEMAALLAQGNSESDKYRFNTAFLTGSDYRRYPNRHRRTRLKGLGGLHASVVVTVNVLQTPDVFFLGK